MSFIADKQTLDDLNLLGKYKPGSVYSLFNKVKTRGGEKLLDEWFRHPLSDAPAINQRSMVFLYLKGKGLVFPFSSGEFGLIEDYLGMGGAGSWLTNMADVLRKKVMEAVVKDEGYDRIFEGVRITVSFLHVCRGFIGEFNASDDPDGLREQVGAAKRILADARLAGLPSFEETASLSWQRVAGLHLLFVHTMEEEMGHLCAILYYLDCCLAVSKVGEEKGFSYAQAFAESEYMIHAADLRHPVLDKAVGNTISLGKDKNVLFLTGANMAGKSTFMKSFGIALYLAHMGFPVAAGDMIFSVREGLYSSINVPDNLAMGYSHFYAEVQRVKTVALEVSQSKSLMIIFDELFKGTNVKDAYDATLAVTAAFAEYRNCFFIISTHIVEVGEALGSKDNLLFAYLPTVMEGSTAQYTYQLKEGITSDRHGMMIIEQEGIVELIKGGVRSDG